MDFKKGSEFFNFLLLTSDFMEWDDGTTFYDYSLFKNIDDRGRYAHAQLFLETSTVKEIIIYGRTFDATSFGSESIQEEYGHIKHTDELFYFKCQNEELMLVFDPFLPQVRLIFHPDEIKSFFFPK